MFEAVTAATGRHEFGIDTIRIDSDAAPEQHIEVLERDVRHVAAKDTGHRVERRLARTVPSNPREVGVEIKGQGCG